MSITSIGSSSNAWQTNQTTSLRELLSRLSSTTSDSSTSSSSSGDTVTISVAALHALLASQEQEGHQGPPPMTDEQAAKMGADIKEQNSDLFTQLDTDEDGTLSADEAEAGKDAIHQAIADGTLKPPAPPHDGQGAPPPPPTEQDIADITAKLIEALHQQGLSDEDIAKTLGTTTQEVQNALQG